MTDHLVFAVDAGVAIMTMNRPEARNALSLEMLEGMAAGLDRAARDESIRCVILRGAGGHFMAGADIRFLDSLKSMSPQERSEVCVERIRTLHNPIINRIRNLPKPVIASVAGSAAGGGVSYALACDLVIASEDAFFVLSQIRIGFTPDVSSTYMLPRLVGVRRAMEIALLGDRLDAASAQALGLINRVVPNADLASETQKLALRLASGPPQAIGRTKQLIAASLERDFASQIEAEAEAFGACARGGEWLEGLDAFLNKRQPCF